MNNLSVIAKTLGECWLTSIDRVMEFGSLRMKMLL